ncbi:MAG: O-antigen ligase family protein [Candidatus Moranbacteria bacterium]|nr:O-antigen ligase family protein [Candidatus Moranbacteria bacterium]
MIEYLFLGLILILPFQFALNPGDNADLAVTRILIPIIFLLWLVRSLAKKKVWMLNKPEMWLSAAFLFFLILSVILGEDSGRGFRKLAYFLSVFPLFWVATDIFCENRFRVKALKITIISGTLAALLGIFQFVLQFVIGLDAELKYARILSPYFLGQAFGKLVESNPSWLVNVSGKTLMRAFGLFPDPHSFSFFVSMCFFIALGYFFYGKGGRFRILAGLGSAMALLAVLFSFSRGAYLGVLAGAIFFIVICIGRSGYLEKILIALSIAALALFLFYSGAISERLASAFNLKEGSNVERMKNWEEAVEIIKDHPLIGVGLGNYAAEIEPTIGERSSIYAHNLFLDIAAETGILNGLIFLLLIFLSIFRGVRSGSAIGLGLSASLVYFLVHGIFDTPLYSPQVLVILLIVLALGVNLSLEKIVSPAEAKS